MVWFFYGSNKDFINPKTNHMPRKYSKGSQEQVHKEMHEMKKGKLRSGRSGKKVTNPRQAIAIGLSEARAEGDKVPQVPRKSSSSRKSSAKKSSAKKSTGKKNPKNSS